MIQIYTPDNTNFDQNGDMILLPETATVHVILGSTWEAELIHPIDDEGRWAYICENAVVKMPSFNGEQLWRIVSTEKNDISVTATMQPIFYDAANEVFLVDVRPTDKSGQEALDILMEDTKYSGESDIETPLTAYYEYKNLLEALNGDIDQSFVNRWGGEIIYDNFTVIINKEAGDDNGVEIRYGKNIPESGFSVTEDMSDVITRIYPKGYDGVTMTGDGYVDSEHIDDYPTVRAETITFDYIYYTADMDEDDIADLEEDDSNILCSTQDELDAALTEACEAEFEDGCDLPSVTIEADMVLLQNTEQYKDIEVLETVSLGDTIHVINTHIGFETEARVIELEYDAILERATSVVLGDFEKDYFSEASSTISSLSSSVDSLSETVTEFNTVVAQQIYAIYASFDTLVADSATIEELTTEIANIKTLYATTVYVAELEANIAEIVTLLAEYATIEYLTTNYLDADYITSNYLSSTVIQATYATITDLEAVTSDITNLSADIATITTLLAGGVATDELTAIHLTSENVVIDDAVITDAMIASLSASKITSGSIYTSLVTIQTAEDDTTLYIDNSLLQIADEDSNIRIQLGLDGEGNYNYYVFDADGNILFDALGIYGEGIHDGVIINDHVASKTSTYTGISGDKLDIDSVITSINEDGSVTIDANSVTIDGETLDYKLTTIEASANSSLSDYTAYYALSTSSTEAPDFYDVTPALVDTAVVDESMADYTSLSSNWSTEYVAATDGYYTWRVYVLESTDGTLTIGEAALITGDAVARASTETLTTELSVVQGRIEALVAFTAIEDWYDGTTTIYDMYSSITVELESITSTVESLETTVNGSDEITGLVSKVSTLEQTSSEISASVSSLEESVDSINSEIGDEDTESTIIYDIAQLKVSVSEISLSVESLDETTSSDYEELSSQIAALTITTGSIQSSVSTLTTDYSTLSASVTTVTQTAESLTVSIESLESITDSLALSDSSIKLSAILTVIEQQSTTNSALFSTTLNDYTVISSQISDSSGENIDDILAVLYDEYYELEDLYYKIYGTDEELEDLDYQIYCAYSSTAVDTEEGFAKLTWSTTTEDELLLYAHFADYAVVGTTELRDDGDSDYYVYYYLEITQDDGTVTQTVYAQYTGTVEYTCYYDLLYNAILNAMNATDEDTLNDLLVEYEDAWSNYMTYEALLESYFSILQTDLLSYSSSNSLTISENSVQAYADDLVEEYADALEALQTQFDSYFIFDNNGLTIGATTSSDEDEYKMVLRNNGLYLECNNEVTAYIASNNETSYLYIVNACVENSLMVGGFSFVPRFNYTLVDSAVVDTDVVGSTNGGMSIIWTES